MKNVLKAWELGVLGLIFLAYTAVRANTLAMTHDEAATFLKFMDLELWKCFLAHPPCWPNANNHLLNSLLMQWSTTLFGDAEWALRLPNWLGHVLYVGSAIFLLLRINITRWVRVFGFLCLVANPYVMDFFSLARGYGLSLSLFLLALVCFNEYTRQPRQKFIWWSFGALFLSVMANFTALVAWMAVWGAWNVWWLLEHKWNIPAILKRNVPPIVLGSLLLGLLFKPIQYLQQIGEFSFGTESLYFTFKMLIQDFLYDQAYGLGDLAQHLLWIIGIPLCVFVLWSLSLLFRFRAKPSLLFWGGISTIMIMALIEQVLQYTILGSQFLIHRRALLFIPLIALIFTIGVDQLRYLGKAWPTIISLFGSLIFLFHFFQTANLTHTREWWYEQNTKEVVEYVNGIGADSNRTMTLTSHWNFLPCIYYYIESGRANHIEMPPWRNDYPQDSTYEFIYVHRGHQKRVPSFYQQDSIFHRGVLMRLQ